MIRSKRSNRYYIGLTNNLERRIEEHNSGKSYWTKRHIPFDLVYYEAYQSLNDAIVREEKLKQFKNSYTELKKRLCHSIELVESGGG